MECFYRKLVMLSLIAGLPFANASAQDITLTGGGADAIWRGIQPNAMAGLSLDQGPVSPGDNRRDLIIGAPGDANIPGAVYIIFGGPVRTGELSLSNADASIQSSTPGDRFGWATAAGNILNTEGAIPRNLVVGAPGASSGRGIVYLFPAGFAHRQTLAPSDAVFTIVGAPGDGLGAAIATADLDNDKHREIIVGAPGNNRIYVIRGTAGLSGNLDLSQQAADFTINGSNIGSVLAAGDVTGDGVYDLLIGSAPNNAVYLLNGQPSGGFRVELAAQFSGVDTGDEAGRSLRLADLDADGRLDIVVGAPGGDGPGNGRTNAGEIYVIWGGTPQASRSLAAADVTFLGPTAGWRIGDALTAGDINRDTPNDLVWLATGGASGGGELGIYYGRARAEIGAALPGGARLVDLAQSGQVSRKIFGDSALGAIRSVQVFEVTGEGARDVIAGVPAPGGGAVYFTLSPRLGVSSSALTLVVPEGGAGSTTFDIRNSSPISITWEVSGAPAWLSTLPASGSVDMSTPSTLRVTANAGALAPGRYEVTLRATSTSSHLTMFLPISVTVTVPQTRFLEVEVPAPNLRLPPRFVLRGWAADTFATSGTGVDRVEVTAYPNDGAGPAISLGAAAYGIARPDIANRLGNGFLNSAFELVVDRLAAGRYRFVVSAHSTASGSWWTRAVQPVTILAAGVPSSFDLNGDSMADLLWQHADGRVSTWLMDGTRLLEGRMLSPGQVPDTNWRIVGTGDVNQDRKPDVFWQHRGDGRLSVWIMDGTVMREGRLLNPSSVPDLSWRVVGVGDLNGDSKPDLVWQNDADGRVSTWLMNGTNLAEGRLLTPSQVPDLNWKIMGIADVNRDGRSDLVWRHLVDGRVSVWLMNGTTMTSGVVLSVAVADPDWEIAALADLNGDGSVDLVWRHRTAGWISTWLMDGTSFTAGVMLQPAQVDTAWRIAGPK